MPSNMAHGLIRKTTLYAHRQSLLGLYGAERKGDIYSDSILAPDRIREH